MRELSPDPATAAMVAQRAGVSVTTVSFALNGKSAQYGLSKSTVQRVMDAAREVNYVPNRLASSLRRKRSHAIGVVFPHLRNDWADQIMEGMFAYLDGKGLVPYIVSHRQNRERQQLELQSLIERRVDGILCNPTHDTLDLYRQVTDRGIPLVFFSDALTEMPQVSYSAWDPAEAALSVQHLIDVGCRRIAYLGFVDHRRMSTASQNMFNTTLRAAGIEPDPRWMVLNPRDEALDETLKKLFSQPVRPDALFVVYDDLAIAAIDILLQMGINVPGDVCVATLGDSPLIGPRAYSITTTIAPIHQEGLEAAQALVHQIEHRNTKPIARLVRGGRLITRASTAKTV